MASSRFKLYATHLKMKTKKKLNIVVFCGGYSNERDISLLSGKEIAKNLNKEKYNIVLSILPNDKKKIIGAVLKNINNKDLAFLALHGEFGEDGKIQAVLETLNIPFTGSSSISSAIAMDKKMTLNIAKNNKILAPKEIKNITNAKFPCILKPNSSGSSIGVFLINSKAELKKALEKNKKNDFLIQEFIEGIELTCGVLGNSDQKNILVMPPVQIKTKEEFFTKKAKYSAKTEEICPANISKKTAQKVKSLAKKVHKLLKCDGLTRSDFILAKNGKLYFLEINTIPGATKNSLCPKEARAMGMSFPEFLDKQIELALKRHEKNRN